MVKEYLADRLDRDTSLMGRRRKLIITYLRQVAEPVHATKIEYDLDLPVILTGSMGLLNLLYHEGRVGKVRKGRQTYWYADPDLTPSLRVR